MILGGLWHGASWTFVIWGAMHGTFLVLERATRLAPSANHSISVAELLVRRLLVFSVVCIAWVFFRDPTLGHALSFLGGFGSFELPAVAASASIYISAHVGAMLAIDSYLERHRTEYLFEDKPYVLRTIAAALLIVATFGFGANQSHAFIYFQF
jgi:D-alanyl-lipoteichoic acid acyltransferase DltB (MBOAT superfamily)